MLRIAPVGRRDQRIGLMRLEIAAVAVDVDAQFEHAAIGLGMKLGGVDVFAMADHLKGAIGRRKQMSAAFGQGLYRLLVADKSVKG